MKSMLLSPFCGSHPQDALGRGSTGQRKALRGAAAPAGRGGPAPTQQHPMPGDVGWPLRGCCCAGSDPGQRFQGRRWLPLQLSTVALILTPHRPDQPAQPQRHPRGRAMAWAANRGDLGPWGQLGRLEGARERGAAALCAYKIGASAGVGCCKGLSFHFAFAT